MLQRFEVVLVPFPFVDADRVKARPAIVLAVGERHGDVPLMFISSRTEMPAAFDELDLLSAEAGFEQTGLRVSSRARITRLVTVSQSLVKRRMNWPAPGCDGASAGVHAWPGRGFEAEMLVTTNDLGWRASPLLSRSGA